MEGMSQGTYSLLVMLLACVNLNGPCLVALSTAAVGEEIREGLFFIKARVLNDFGICSIAVMSLKLHEFALDHLGHLSWLGGALALFQTNWLLPLIAVKFLNSLFLLCLASWNLQASLVSLSSEDETPRVCEQEEEKKLSPMAKSLASLGLAFLLIFSWEVVDPLFHIFSCLLTRDDDFLSLINRNCSKTSGSHLCEAIQRNVTYSSAVWYPLAWRAALVPGIRLAIVFFQSRLPTSSQRPMLRSKSSISLSLSGGALPVRDLCKALLIEHSLACAALFIWPLDTQCWDNPNHWDVDYFFLQPDGVGSDGACHIFRSILVFYYYLSIVSSFGALLLSGPAFRALVLKHLKRSWPAYLGGNLGFLALYVFILNPWLSDGLPRFSPSLPFSSQVISPNCFSPTIPGSSSWKAAAPATSASLATPASISFVILSGLLLIASRRRASLGRQDHSPPGAGREGKWGNQRRQGRGRGKMPSEKPLEVVQKFLDSTTCHGLQQIKLAKRIQAVLWGTLTACLAVLCCVYLYQLLQQVRMYKVQLIPTISDQPVPFPAITVCNINPFMTSKLGKIPELSAIEKYTKAKMNAYEGTQAQSASGKTCLAWKDTDFPRELSNHCRNPNYEASGPWCYVAPDTPETCGIDGY